MLTCFPVRWQNIKQISTDTTDGIRYHNQGQSVPAWWRTLENSLSFISQFVFRTTPSDEDHYSAHTQCAPWPGEVTDPRAARWGQVEMFPELEDFAGARHQGRSRHRSWLHVSPCQKNNENHYFICLATVAPKFLKTEKKLQLSDLWKLLGFTQKTKCHMLPWGANLIQAVIQNSATWIQNHVTSAEIKTSYTQMFSCMTNYICTT